MKKTVILFLFVLVLIFPFKGFSQEPDYLWDYQYDVPYVPTPHEVVQEMLKMAKVGKNDYLYDLGCGDGRIVITAVKDTGCRGVGIDIDPQRIEESKNNAAEAGVTDKVKFLQQDLFEADFSKATVLTLYLLQTVNLELRPKILRVLKPGTRVVSHDFSMKDWEADKRTEVKLERRSHSIYFWIVPANVSGTWNWISSKASGKDQYVLKLEQQFQKIKGTLYINGSGLSIARGELVGDKLQFTVGRMLEGQTVRMLFSAKVKGNSIQGSLRTETDTAMKTSKWEAKRDPYTVVPIEGSDKLR
ncbi:MAG: class I SAM-dependent methyltransferase [Candidatus Aminicenantes bacterium]|nr:MAG: class I SAM-dependent methyltransferase [Candidatus Aminicenantes bacterium]